MRIIATHRAAGFGAVVAWAVLLGASPPGVQAAEGQTSEQAQGVAKAEEAHFDVMEYRVIGNTVLTNREIETVLYPLLGPNKTLKDVESAKAALEGVYHDRGYGTVFVDIPPQKVSGGLVRLRVTEGRVESERIGGAKYFPEREVIAALPAAQPGQVLQLSKLQEELTAVNTVTPDRSVVPILKAGSEPGTVDLTLQVNDKLPLHGSLELNNQASLDTDSLRAIASLSYADMFGRLDDFSFQYQTTPQKLDQVRVYAANYAFHPLASGLAPSLEYINSNSNVAAINTLGVLGIGQIGGFRLAYPFSTAANSTQSVALGIDYKHFRNLVNQNATTAVDSPISYLNLSLAYMGLWRADWHTTTWTMAANLGPRHAVNSQSSFEAFRVEGNANYFYLRSDLSNEFKLPGNFILRLRAAGQAAAEPLITNEDFSIAGIDGVRGYLESEVLGDEGLKGTAQLTSPGWRWHERMIGDVFTFFDEGRTWNLETLKCQPAGTGLHLRSWGGGLDLLPGQKVTGGVTWARALDSATDLPAVAVSGGCPASGPATRAGDSRVLFFLRGSF